MNQDRITMEDAAKCIQLYCDTVRQDPVAMGMLNIRMLEIEAEERWRGLWYNKIKYFLIEDVQNWIMKHLEITYLISMLALLVLYIVSISFMLISCPIKN
jgi:hypothetical protein